MCGRTACALAPDDIRKACTYKDRKGRRQKPEWRDAPNGKQYKPSHNIAPGAHTPVMMSSKHLPDADALSCERVIQPMMWGLVPSWHKGTLAEKAFETNNCRAESMMEKSTYKVPLHKGRRCVILAEGFFEWKREKAAKQPYYIYFPQKNNNSNQADVKVKVEGQIEVKQEQDSNSNNVDVKVKAEGQTEVKKETEVKQEQDSNSNHVDVKVKAEGQTEVKQETTDSSEKLSSDNVPVEEEKIKSEEVLHECGNGKSEDKGSGVPRMLTMAGVFDVWEPKGGDPVYSYSVITVESSSAMSWIHHRMPAMLTTDEEIDQWLSFGEVPLNKAVKLIRPTTTLESHPVSTVVNNSRNNTPDCVKKIDLSKPKLSASGNMMMSWLSKGRKKEPDSNSQEPPNKKTKLS